MPDNYGWKRDSDKDISVMTALPPEPEAPQQLIKCGYKTSLCETSRCNCKANHSYGNYLCWGPM